MAKQPTSRAKGPRRTLQRVDPKRTLTPVQVEQLRSWALTNLHAATDATLTRDAAITLVLLGTGARRFELCAFRCGDFYRGPSGPIAHFVAGKGNKEADVDISETTFEIVTQWIAYKQRIGEAIEARAPLFCGRVGEFMATATLNLIWDRVLVASGLPKIDGVGVHVTRHAAGMLLLRATNSLSQTAAFLRHSSERVTERFYKHVLPSDIRAGLTKAGI